VTSKIEREFTDREREIALFAQMVHREIPQRVLAIQAPGGIGKSWLIDRYEAWCKTERVPCVRLDFDPTREDGPLSPEIILEKAGEAMGLMPASDLETFARLLKEMTGGPASVQVGADAVISGGARFGDIGNVIIKELHVSAPNLDSKTRRHRATHRFRRALAACGPQPAVWLVDTCERAAENTDTADWLSGAILGHVACEDALPLVIVLTGRSLPPIKSEWEDCIRRISLDPFDEKQTHVLVCERIGLTLAAETVSFLHRVSGGVPQTMVGLVETYLCAGGGAMSDDILRDMLAKLQPGMSQKKVFAAILDDTLAAEGASAAEAFLACAVLHWFDAPLLAALLEKPESEANALLTRVTRYSFVSQRPDGAYLYHENARAHLLARVKQDADHFREMSRRAAEFFAPTPLARRPFGTGEGAAGEFVFEWLYHWLAVDDEQAFDQLMNLYQQLEFHYNLAACGRLLALAQEQRDLLTGDRPQWLRYYQGRLLQYSRRWPEALAAWKPLLQEELAPKLKSWLANHMGMVYDSLGRWADALAHYQTSLAIKRELGDRQGEAQTLNDIGLVYQLQGQWADALAQYQTNLAIKRELGDQQGEAQTLNNIANIYQAQGKWADALAHYQQSLDIFRELGDRQGESTTLTNIANVYQAQGKWADALAHCQTSLAIKRELGDRQGEGGSLMGIANVYQAQGKWADALAHYQTSLAIKRELGDRQGEASTLGSLGILSRKTGRWDEAVSYYKQQLEICRELGDRPGESGVLNNLGVVYAKKGLWTEAIQCYEDSLKLEREMGDRLEEARTLGNLGDVFKETGEWAKAEDYNKQAVAILHDSEDKEQLGDRLEELGELYRTRGLWAEAVQVHEEALQVWRELAAMRRE
jgi:tetratricopeptide (TPR) repeat protein